MLVFLELPQADIMAQSIGRVILGERNAANHIIESTQQRWLELLYSNYNHDSLTGQTPVGNFARDPLPYGATVSEAGTLELIR